MKKKKTSQCLTFSLCAPAVNSKAGINHREESMTHSSGLVSQHWAHWEGRIWGHQGWGYIFVVFKREAFGATNHGAADTQAVPEHEIWINKISSIAWKQIYKTGDKLFFDWLQLWEKAQQYPNKVKCPFQCKSAKSAKFAFDFSLV